MVIEKKIQAAKSCFEEIQESGRNNYQKFKYMETKDIFPLVRKVCEKYQLRTLFDWDITANIFSLVVTDEEDNSSVEFGMPLAPVNASDCGKYMQDLGRCQTYAMRYLYIRCFEIAVPDEIDNRDQKKQQKANPKPSKKRKEIVKEEEPDPTIEDVKKALDKCYDIISVQAGKEFTEGACIFQLGRQYPDNPKLVDACKKALKTYTAEKKYGG